MCLVPKQSCRHYFEKLLIGHQCALSQCFYVTFVREKAITKHRSVFIGHPVNSKDHSTCFELVTKVFSLRCFLFFCERTLLMFLMK
jgi:hypothetical protein